MKVFRNRVRRAKIHTELQDYQLTVYSEPVEWATHYACYLYLNNNVVLKKGYQTGSEFKFDLSPYYPLDGQIKVRYYFRDNLNDLRDAKAITTPFYSQESTKRTSDFKATNASDKQLRLWVLSQEERKFTNRKLQKLGEVLVKEKQLQLGPFPQYQITDSFDFWENDPFENRSWQWRVHWLEFVNHLLSYHYRSQNSEALEFAQKGIESWWDSYWGTKSNFEFIRHDHATALRAEVLLTYYCYIEEYAPTYFSSQKSFFDRLRQFLIELKAQLLDEDFYTEHTNHGLEQVRVLLLLGIYFQDIKAQEIAVKRIYSELDFSFTEEGVHKENSPGYHQFVFKLFLEIIGFFPKQVLGGLSNRFNSIGTKALEFLAHIIRPDGYLPIIGDTELIKPSDSYGEHFKNDLAYQEFLYSSSLGRRGQKPRTNFKVYEKSGYAIYRNQWGNRNNFDQTVQLILKAGCLSRYHHQQDEGNILLYAYGEDWLIDSGLYNYINADPIRKYMRSRHAHNIPIIPGSIYDNNFQKRINNWDLKYQYDEEIGYQIQTTNRVLVGIEHKREVTILPVGATENKKVIESKFNVIDTLTFKGENEIRLNWHFPKDKGVKIVNESTIEIIGKSKKLVLKLDEHAEQINILKGRSSRKVHSLLSNKFGVIEESVLIQVTYNKNLDDSFVVTSSFEFLDINPQTDKAGLDKNGSKDKSPTIKSDQQSSDKKKLLNTNVKPYKYQLRHYAFKPYYFTLPLDWRVNPYKNKNWQHHLMSLRWINGKALGEENLLKLLVDFYNFHVRKEVHNPYYNFLRGDHTASIRLRVLTDIYYQYINSNNLPLLGIITRLIRADIYNLQQKEIYRAGHNHALMVDNALLSILCDERLGSFHHLINLNLIIERSLATVRMMYYDDGFTRENSISYQEYNLDIVLEYIRFIKRLDVQVEFNVESIIEESKKVLGFCLTQNDLYFPIGDSYYAPKLKILEAVYGSKSGSESDIKSLLLPYSSNEYIGYYFNKGLVVYKYEDVVHFAQTIMYGSNTHKQNDELSYCLNVYGIPFVIDSGYSVICSTETYEYVRSELAHSNIRLLNESYTKIEDIKEYVVLDRFISYEDNKLTYEFSHDRYKGYRITSNVSIDNTSLFLNYSIVNIDPNSQKEKGLQGRVLSIVLHPDVSITKKESKLVLYSNSFMIKLEIFCEGNIQTKIVAGKTINEKEDILNTKIVNVHFNSNKISIRYYFK